MKNIMTRAWEIAREAVAKFGGKVKEFFAQSLKFAWSEFKGGVKMVELKGSEKQVKWASEIRTHVIALCEEAISIKKANYEEKGKTEEQIQKRLAKPLMFVENLKNNDDAAWFIQNFKILSNNNYSYFLFEREMKEMQEAKALNMDLMAQGFSRYKEMNI